MSRRSALELALAFAALAAALCRRAVCRHFWEPSIDSTFPTLILHHRCNRCGGVRHEGAPAAADLEGDLQ